MRNADSEAPTGRCGVIVLAGPSGAGKSRLAQRLALPVLRLDDFYREVTSADLPRIHTGPNAGMVDWDHPHAWDHERAVDALVALCRTGVARVPSYDLHTSTRTGHHDVTVGTARHFVAEGIFAAHVVADCQRLGILTAAYCVTQHPMLTFWRRLTRDLREHRKPPGVLLARGWTLMRTQGAVVREAVALGCTPVSSDVAYAALRSRLSDPSA